MAQTLWKAPIVKRLYYIQPSFSHPNIENNSDFFLCGLLEYCNFNILFSYHADQLKTQS